MDLKLIDTISAVETPQTFVLTDLDGEPTDIKFTIYGYGSKAFKQAHAKLERQKQLAMKRGKPLDEDQEELLWCEIIAACVTGWENVEEDGKPVEFNKDNAVDLFERYPYFRNRILEQIHSVRDFLER